MRRTVDGDSIHADIDMDLKAWLMDYPVRLAGCAAAPKSTESGAGAMAYLATLLPVGEQLILLTIRNYKFGGEFIARVIRARDGLDVVADMIAQNWAVPWDGTGKQPLPPWPRP